jgi:hypothetical protein
VTLEAEKSYLYWYIFETTVHNNSASSSAATNWHRHLTKDKIRRFFMTLIVANEEVELLFTVISGAGTDMIIPPHVPVP